MNTTPDPLIKSSLGRLADRYFRTIEQWRDRSQDQRFWACHGKQDSPEVNLRHSVARHFESHHFTPVLEVSSLFKKGSRKRLDLVLIGAKRVILCEVKLLYSRDFFSSLVSDGRRLESCGTGDGKKLRLENGLQQQPECLLIGSLWTAEKYGDLSVRRLDMIEKWKARTGPMRFFFHVGASTYAFSNEIDYKDGCETVHVLTASWKLDRTS